MQKSSFAPSGTVVIQPTGHLNATNAAALQQQLVEVVSSEESCSLLIDMGRVESLDSTGLMVLVSTLTLAQRLDKRFALTGVSPSVRIVLELTQLDRVFEIVDHARQEAAVA